MGEDDAGPIVIYTSENELSGELFLYIYAHVAASRANVRVVATTPAKQNVRRILSRTSRRFHRLGWAASLEILSSLYFKRKQGAEDAEEISAGIRALERPVHSPNLSDVLYVRDANGKKAVEVLGALKPAMIVQAGAGILKARIFEIPTLGALNLHHGIAPLVRGMSSIYWGLWENRPDWIGATVHYIDEGIDTGRPLAYFRVDPIGTGEGFPSLFVRATQGGVANLVRVIDRLMVGDIPNVTPPNGESSYRSTFSGWKSLLLKRRLERARRGRLSPPGMCP